MVKFLRRNWILILIFILGLSVSWPLFRSGYFSHQDDLHIIRVVEMRKCFSDLQIPCRWVPDMGWGNGMPLFNFYGVFTYYFGGIVSYFIGYLAAAKFLFFIALILGSYGIYLLVEDLLGKYAGLTSAVLYLFAPYKALDIYVRGALTESLALAIIPFVFYFFKKKEYRYAIITLFFFLITHNIMTIIFLPVLFTWILYWLVVTKFEELKPVLIFLVIAFGMSAFFILPAFLEKGLVQTESLTRFELDYRANFISLKQLFFDRVWGYGTSIPGPTGAMNFQIGWPHWLLAIISILAIFSKKIERKAKYLVLAIFTTFLMSAFMTHNKSTFIWEKINILTFFQFPWRFLSLSIFTSSILGGFTITLFGEKYRSYVATFMILLTVVLNWNYFKPREFYNITEEEKLSGELWESQRKGAILDYLPKTALEPREGAPTMPEIITGIADITNFVNKSDSFKFNVKVTKESQIDIPVYYFPNWKVTVNGKKHDSNHNNLLGRISINLPIGEYKIEGKFRNTLLRNVSNMLSLLSASWLIFIWKKFKK
ncbi:MAG: hypothetical protein ACD_26C00034G0081 [uncultured bacterium]|nr:MAG: hypothetical protein ACD_26C00034G0081 [uncultured bacterium]